jgi:hypothetical protein
MLPRFGMPPGMPLRPGMPGMPGMPPGMPPFGFPPRPGMPGMPPGMPPGFPPGFKQGNLQSEIDYITLFFKRSNKNDMMDAEMIAEIIVKKETLSVQKDLEEIATESAIAIETVIAIAVGETMTRAAIGVARGAAHEIVRETSAIGRGIATETEALEEATGDLDRDRAIEIDTVDDNYSVKLNCQSNFMFNSKMNHMLKNF